MTKIAKFRKARGWTQQRLADEMNVTQAAVAHWESGRRTPTLSTMRELARVLRVALTKLIA